MRYDVRGFKVLKYKNQDVYKNLHNEKVLLVVEKSTLPSNCTEVVNENEYNNCYIQIDNYTAHHYISFKNKVYKVTVKTPGITEIEEKTKIRIDNMINSFSIN